MDDQLMHLRSLELWARDMIAARSRRRIAKLEGILSAIGPEHPRFGPISRDIERLHAHARKWEQWADAVRWALGGSR